MFVVHGDGRRELSTPRDIYVSAGFILISANSSLTAKSKFSFQVAVSHVLPLSGLFTFSACCQSFRTLEVKPDVW